MTLTMAEQEYWKEYTLKVVQESIGAIKHYENKVLDLDSINDLAMAKEQIRNLMTALDGAVFDLDVVKDLINQRWEIEK